MLAIPADPPERPRGIDVQSFTPGTGFQPLRVTASFDAPQPQATFAEAISRFWRKYVTFTGRASLSEFWRMVAFELILALVLIVGVMMFAGAISASASGGGEVAGRIASIVVVCVLVAYRLATLIPWTALAMRRLHDANLSGAFVLLAVIGFGFVVLILCALSSNPTGARYDAPPAVSR
jgi:uncharacterized membrane protein YhaH (DUF805 family)